MGTCQSPASINLSELYKDAEKTANENNFAPVARAYIEYVFRLLVQACEQYAQANATDVRLVKCMQATTRLLNRIATPWLEDQPVGILETAQIPIPDIFFHPQIPTNHLIRVMAPEGDDTIPCDALLSICKGLSHRFDPGAVATYATQVALMQCIDFARSYYSYRFAYTWMDEELIPSSGLRSSTGPLLCALYLVSLLETAFNTIPYLRSDITTESAL